MHGSLQLSSTRTAPKRKSSPRRNRGSSAEETTRRLLRSTATKPDEQIENPTCGNDAVPSLFAHVFLVQHDNRERHGEDANPPQNPQPRFALLRGLLRGLLGLGRDLRLESWLGGWLIAGLLRRISKNKTGLRAAFRHQFNNLLIRQIQNQPPLHPKSLPTRINAPLPRAVYFLSRKP